MILILSRKKKESEISVRPTENETDEEKNEAMWRDADTHQAVEREQHNVGVMKH